MLYGSARNQIKGEAAEQWALAWERSVAGRPGDEKIDFVPLHSRNSSRTQEATF